MQLHVALVYTSSTDLTIDLFFPWGLKWESEHFALDDLHLSEKLC